MKKSFVVLIFCLGAAVLTVNPGCKSKVTDTDIKTSAQTTLQGNPDYAGVSVTIIDGVATLSGEVKDESVKSAAEKAVKDVKGVKSVTNNITVASPLPPVEVSADSQLTTAVNDAVKDHPGVTATISDGVITLTGQIKRADLQILMQKLNALNPKKVDNKLTVQ